jgi:ABC-type uncharacterized transport system involved in gliding motility auxiliary subunit
MDNMAIGVGRLAEEYSVQRLRTSELVGAIPDSIDVIVVAGPQTPFTGAEGGLLESFLDRGGSLLLMLNGAQADVQTRFAQPTFHPVLDSLLSRRGLGVLPAIAYDMSSNEPVPLQTAGGYVLQQYPLWPVAFPLEHPITRDGNTLLMRWTSPLYLEDADTTRVTPLLTTTEFGGRLRAPGSIDPTLDWEAIVDPDALEPQVLAAAYQGDEGSRIVLVGSRDIIEDGSLQAPGGVTGLVFFQNAVDWLAQDEALIAIRAKDRAPPQLLFPSTFARDATKWGNLAGVPLLFILIGILRLTRRRGTQRRTFESGGAII